MIKNTTFLPGISVAAPIRRSTPWAFIRKNFQFVPTMEMSTLFSFPSKNQINAQGAATENPRYSTSLASSQGLTLARCCIQTRGLRL